MDYNYSKKDYYFRVDERTNTFDSLKKVSEFLNKIDEDDFYWKWAMIALHNALYGSMILSLIGSNPSRVEGGRKSKKQKEKGEHFVIGFREAFRRIQIPERMEMYGGSKFICINPESEKLKQNPKYKNKTEFFLPELGVSIEHLNDYIRNQFLHYYPVSISFGKGGFIEIIEQILPLIKFLLLESGNVRIDSEEEMDSIKNLIEKSNLLIKKIKKQFYDSRSIGN